LGVDRAAPLDLIAERPVVGVGNHGNIRICHGGEAADGSLLFC
jgi:hypothetical protein